jgi:hypothetical protein
MFNTNKRIRMRWQARIRSKHRMHVPVANNHRVHRRPRQHEHFANFDAASNRAVRRIVQLRRVPDQSLLRLVRTDALRHRDLRATMRCNLASDSWRCVSVSHHVFDSRLHLVDVVVWDVVVQRIFDVVVVVINFVFFATAHDNDDNDDDTCLIVVNDRDDGDCPPEIVLRI